MLLKSISVHRKKIVMASVILTIFLIGMGVGTTIRRDNNSFDSKLLKEYQYNSTAITFNQDTKHYDSQWVQDLTNLRHERTKFAVGVLMKDEDFTRLHWMGDGGVKDTTLFFVTDSIDLNSVQKLDDNMYGLTFQSNTTKEAGFYGADVYHGDGPHAWAKVTFFFCRLAPKYDFVWVIENDVYIPSMGAFLAMLSLSESQDMVARSSTSRTDSRGWEHWSHADEHFSLPKPWHQSLVCVLGMSRKMLNSVDNYIHQYQNMGFIEYFFPSIAVHAKLSIMNPSTLRTIGFDQCVCDDVNNSNMNWFHPVKNQTHFRADCGY